MISSKKTYLVLITASLIIAILVFYPFKKVHLVLLTWENNDTSHNMVINYITDRTSQTAMVYYDTTTRNGDPASYSHTAQGEVRTYPGVEFKVHSTRLTNLDPDKTYYFIVGDETTGYSNERKFRTVPETGVIRFISGGDASVSEAFEEVCKIAAESDPHFAIIGGDIAYADGKIKSQQLWLELLDIWQRTMVTAEGYTIPVIAAIGNHEVAPSSQPPKKPPTQSLFDNAPFYHMIFHPAADKTFFKRQIGKDTILFVLDTDHIYPSGGEQTQWMNENFAQHRGNKFRFASYHVPLYPSYRDPKAPAHVLLRKHWLGTFDQNHLDVAFENHEHTLKKSKLLRNHQVVEALGTYYIGDGDWGTISFTPVERWYLQASRPINHVWAVTLKDDTASFKALTVNGIDESYSFEIKTRKNAITK